jgi:hypothetical protein
MDTVSMYVDVLSNALNGWAAELAGTELLDYARSCRDAVQDTDVCGAARSLELLAAEVAYDRALVRLCELKGIAVDVSWFVHPDEARRCLEHQLAALGLDLGNDTASGRAGG